MDFCACPSHNPLKCDAGGKKFKLLCCKRTFDRIKGNLAKIQPKNHQNVQKAHFLQKVPGVNGLMWVSESSFGSVLKSTSQREFVCFPSLFGHKLVWLYTNKKRLLMSYFQIYFLWGWFSKITRHENVRRPIFNALVKENEGQIKQKTTFALAPIFQKVILMLTFRGCKKIWQFILFENSRYIMIANSIESKL